MPGNEIGLERLGGDEGLPDKLLSLLLQQIPSGFMILEAPSGEPVLSNRQMGQIWGAAAPEPGASPEEWRGYHPDGRPYTPEEWPHARALRGVAVREPEEIEIARTDGTRGLVRMTAVPLENGGGNMVAVLVNCLDISENRRRSTSRKFLTEAWRLLSSSTDYLTTLQHLARLAVPTLADWCTIDLLDPDGTLRRVAVEHIDRRKARAAIELARRHPPPVGGPMGVGKVVQEGVSELIAEVTPDLLERFSYNPAHLRLLQELGVQSVMFVPLIVRDRTLGAISFVSAESKRRYTQDDLEVAEELAARAALAIENSRLFDQSRAASEAKSDFLAVMSHELRTPLTAIIGYAELLQLGVPDPVTPRQYEQAERIEVSARHLLQLIEEILMLVSLDSGEDRVRPSQVRPNELIRRAAAVIEPMARAKGLPLEVEPAEEDAELVTDVDKLLQILLNLLSNAVKFTEAGQVSISAVVSNSTCTFEIRDTGVGLEKAHVDQIFEPFWQVERPITRKAGGTGLGLAIVQRLAEMLGGEIQVASEAGVGSAFRVVIPLRMQRREERTETPESRSLA